MKKEIEERYKKTKFAKGGGSCFECCDYEEMDTELREFIQREVEKAIQQERERINEQLKRKIIAYVGNSERDKIRNELILEIQDIIKTLKQ